MGAKIKKIRIIMKPLIAILTCMLICGCQRNCNQSWENVKTAGRYVQKGFNSLWGKDTDSRLLTCDEDFSGPDQDEYIPLQDSDLKTQFAATDKAIPQQKLTPATLPKKANFTKPNSKLLDIFRTIHFETNDHVVREKYDLISIARIANYLKKNKNSYLLVEGHCDPRASADYNMALGTRRANHVRVLLVKQGVDPKKVITVSYGKEKLITFGSTPQDWAINRRSEFKIYEK
jgi:outer membrane protein OmpA-like peptidoglycan-associated protein